MSNDEKAPDPFGLSTPAPAQERAPGPFAAPSLAGEEAAEDPYAALTSGEGPKVQQPTGASYDDIFGGGETSAPQPAPPTPGPPAMGAPFEPGFDEGFPSPPGSDSYGGLPPVSRPNIPIAQPGGGGGKLLGLFAVVLIAGGLGYFFFSSRAKPETTTTTEVVPDEALPEIDLAQVLAERPRNAPRCWKSNEGYNFGYKDAAGEAVLVATVEEVPTIYRAGAECVRD